MPNQYWTPGALTPMAIMGKYYMYYSVPPFRDDRPGDGWAIGIAGSNDLQSWDRIGDILR